MEYCLDSKMFEELVAAAQTDFPQGIMSFVLSLITQILAGIKNQVLLAQTSINSALCVLLHVISGKLLSGQEYHNSKSAILKLICELINLGYQDPGILDIFVYKNGEREEFLPMNVLMMYFQDEYVVNQTEIRDSLIMISQIENNTLFHLIHRQTEIALTLITKLAFYFQTIPVILDSEEKHRNLEGQVKELVNYAQFLDIIYTETIHEDFKNSIANHFYEDFCVLVLTPRLQSMDKNIRCTTTFAACVILQEFTNVDLVLPFVYFLQGRSKNGEKRLNFLVSTPTYKEQNIMHANDSKVSTGDSSGDSTHQLNTNLRNQGCKPLSDVKKM